MTDYHATVDTDIPGVVIWENGMIKYILMGKDAEKFIEDHKEEIAEQEKQVSQ